MKKQSKPKSKIDVISREELLKFAKEFYDIARKIPKNAKRVNLQYIDNHYTLLITHE